MKLHDFSINVVGGTERAGGYVYMDHKQQYSLRIKNCGDKRADCTIRIDGKKIGIFRIDSREEYTIERSIHDSGKLTFFKLNSKEAAVAELNLVTKDNLGLIEAEFVPETKYSYRKSKVSSQFKGLATFGVTNLSCGGTGLTGKSKQEFYNAEDIDLDRGSAVVIYLRLVCNEDNSVRPLLENRKSTSFPTPI